MIFAVGRVCVKLAGRDAGKKCVILNVNDDSSVLIDGQTRRRVCNVAHLEPTTQILEIAENADHESVIKAFASVDVGVPASSGSKKSAVPRPKKQKKNHSASSA